MYPDIFEFDGPATQGPVKHLDPTVGALFHAAQRVIVMPSRDLGLPEHQIPWVGTIETIGAQSTAKGMEIIYGVQPDVPGQIRDVSEDRLIPR